MDSVLDVGSGSGIPGIALKILYPKIELTIVESVTKKTLFLKELVKKLNLQNVIILNERAEELDKKYKNKFDLVTARAVAELRIILELLIPYMKINGLCVLPKGNKSSEEMQAASHIVKKMKIYLVEKLQYESSDEHKEFVYIFTKKEDTPSIYPRK
ncbi:16S rRNA (guanine(527)-N(7))-methyltransferase RsmG [bacterium]|nr:16S rRNA (guanine(527)-N(7))-methyltransferase RsmG [bacterium]